MTKKKVYFIALAVVFLLGFATSSLTKFSVSESAYVDVSALIIFIVAIVVGPIGSLVCAVGAMAGSYVVFATTNVLLGLELYPLISLAVNIVEGVACGYLYKYTLRDSTVIKGKIISILCACLLATVCSFALEFLWCMNLDKMLVGFVSSAVARFIGGSVACLILPAVPHFFDEQRYKKDLELE